jgi:hypothetical protein
MRFVLFCGMALLSVVSCKNRDFAQSDVASKKNDNDKKFPPFDAFLIWEDGQGLKGEQGVYEYPSSYDSSLTLIPKEIADHVFYEDLKDYTKATEKSTNDPEGWVGTPTKGISVTDGVLKYPETGGRKLSLRFGERSEKRMNQIEARHFCEKNNQRLPTLRELFDFCTAEKEATQKGRFKDNRCSTPASSIGFISVSGYWSASLLKHLPGGDAYFFDSNRGEVIALDRTFPSWVICVGKNKK